MAKIEPDIRIGAPDAAQDAEAGHAGAATKLVGRVASESSHPVSVSALASLLSGLIFGIALYKAGVYQVDVIRDQFLFRNWAMMKIFMVGSGSSILVLSIMGALPSTSAALEEASLRYRTTSMGVPVTWVGASLLGAGMAIAGSCPGTIYVQWGALMWRAFFSFGGLVLGSILFALLHPDLQAFQLWKPLPDGKHTLYELLGVSRLKMGLALSTMMFAAVGVIEWFSPSQLGGVLEQRWHPAISGLMVGLSQIPLTLTLHRNAGCSSTFLTFVATVLYPVLRHSRRWAYFETRRVGIRNWWQVIFGAAISTGAAIVMVASGSPAYDPTAAQLSWWEGVLGGTLAALGSRLADGCTSGHGMSGAAHMAVRSFGAIAFMFGSAIATAMLLYR